MQGRKSEARHCEPSSGLLLSPLPERVQGRESDACWYLCCLPSIVCASCPIIFVSIIIMFLGHKSQLLIQASIIIISNNWPHTHPATDSLSYPATTPPIPSASRQTTQAPTRLMTQPPSHTANQPPSQLPSHPAIDLPIQSYKF